jgi:hypothetical protein
MKEYLEKIGVSDFFAYICSGLILLASFAVWKLPDFGSAFWKQQAVVILLGVILSYTIGQIIASWVDKAWARYNRQDRLANLRRVLMKLFCSAPPHRLQASVIEASLRITQDLEQLSHSGGLSNKVAPWDRLTIYRALKVDQLGPKVQVAVAEAENFQRGFLFSIGMAVAIRLVAVQSLIRFAILAGFSFVQLRSFSWYHIWQATSSLLTGSVWLVILSILCFWASDQLRQIGIRMWEGEIYLTASLTERNGADVPPNET